MNAKEIVEKIKSGSVLFIYTHTHATRIDKKCVVKFEKLGLNVLTDDGEGLRVKSGKGSYYVFPNQIKLFSPINRIKCETCNDKISEIICTCEINRNNKTEDQIEWENKI